MVESFIGCKGSLDLGDLFSVTTLHNIHDKEISTKYKEQITACLIKQLTEAVSLINEYRKLIYAPPARRESTL